MIFIEKLITMVLIMKRNGIVFSKDMLLLIQLKYINIIILFKKKKKVFLFFIEINNNN